MARNKRYNENYNKKYKIIWSVKKEEKFRCKKNKNVRFVSKENALSNLIYIYYLNRTKIFLFTHPYWLKKKKEGQTIINLWHGIPLKGQGDDLSDIYDYAIVTSESTKPLFSKFIYSLNAYLKPDIISVSRGSQISNICNS